MILYLVNFIKLKKKRKLYYGGGEEYEYEKISKEKSSCRQKIAQCRRHLREVIYIYPIFEIIV